MKLLSKSLIRRCGLFRFAQRGRFSKLSAVKALFGRGETCKTCFQVFRRPVRVYGLAGSSEKAFCFGAAVYAPIKLIRYDCFALHSEIRCPASVYQSFRLIL
ncbi:hypothetical protein [Neisseria mucosa]|uniref:hypothetical protein n=1 Tax=Neisseria mucosa TaxID=488 RepID=UPI0019210F5B|nr:hypothetical protein [Neisseria mucosa]